MNLQSDISPSEFDHLWSEIEYEFNKITTIKTTGEETNIPSRCNGITTYNNMFKIISSKQYSNNLYWKIGEYLYNVAKQRRIFIPYAQYNNTLAYLPEYSTYFLQFQDILSTIDSLSLVLNRSIENNKPIKQLGYLLWERCILQEIEKINNKSIGTEIIDIMFKEIENDYSNIDNIKILSIKPKNEESDNKTKIIITTLKSLKRIIPDNNPLSYYKLSYEEPCFNRYIEFLINVKNNSIKYNTLKEYIIIIENIFSIELERRNIYFLKESYVEHKNILEEIFIIKEKEYIIEGIYQLLMNNKEIRINNNINIDNIKYIYIKLINISSISLRLFEESLDRYISTSFSKKIEDKEVKEKKKDFNFIISIYQAIYTLIEIINNLENDILIETVYNKYKEYYKDSNIEYLLAKFSMYNIKNEDDKILGCKYYNNNKDIEYKGSKVEDNNNNNNKNKAKIEDKNKNNKNKDNNKNKIEDNNNITNISQLTPYNYDAIITVYEYLINILTDIDLFICEFIKFLGVRLLAYNFDDRKEKMIHEKIKEYNYNLYNRINRMYQDINRSISINSCINAQRSEGVEDKITNSTSVCFVSILTECIWPIEKGKDRELSIDGNNDILLPSELLEYKNLFVLEYNRKYSRRKIDFVWGKGHVDINVFSDREYCIRLNIYQYILLSLAESGVSENVIGQLAKVVEYYRNVHRVNVCEDDISVLVDNGLVFVGVDHKLYINYTFTSGSERICMLPVYRRKNTVIKSDPLTVVQAVISSIMKRAKKVAVGELEGLLREERRQKDFEVLKDYFSEAVVILVEKGLIEEEDGLYHYVP